MKVGWSPKEMITAAAVSDPVAVAAAAAVDLAEGGASTD